MRQLADVCNEDVLDDRVYSLATRGFMKEFMNFDINLRDIFEDQFLLTADGHWNAAAVRGSINSEAPMSFRILSQNASDALSSRDGRARLSVDCIPRTPDGKKKRRSSMDGTPTTPRDTDFGDRPRRGSSDRNSSEPAKERRRSSVDGTPSEPGTPRTKDRVRRALLNSDGSLSVSNSRPSSASGRRASLPDIKLTEEKEGEQLAKRGSLTRSSSCENTNAIADKHVSASSSDRGEKSLKKSKSGAALGGRKSIKENYAERKSLSGVARQSTSGFEGTKLAHERCYHF